MNAARPFRVPSPIVIVLLALTMLAGLVAAPRIGRAAASPLTPTSALVQPVSSPGRAAPATGLLHLVRPGETLWKIARTYHPRGDIRPFVRDLARANGGADLRVGQRLVLPPST